jgi:hypothetical protein
MLNDKGNEIAMNSIEIVDSSKFADAYIHQLSHGMKKECRIDLPHAWQINGLYGCHYKKMIEEFRELRISNEGEIGDKEIASMVAD